MCVLKTHVDIFDQWDDGIVQQLQALAEKHGVRTLAADPLSVAPFARGHQDAVYAVITGPRCMSLGRSMS